MTTTMRLDIAVMDIKHVINPFERTIDKIIPYTSSVKSISYNEGTIVTIDGDDITVNVYWELFLQHSVIELPRNRIIKLHKDSDNHYSGHYSQLIGGKEDYSYPIHIFKIDDKLIRVIVSHSTYIVICENERMTYESIGEDIIGESPGVTQSMRDVLDMIKLSTQKKTINDIVTSRYKSPTMKKQFKNTIEEVD